MAAVFFIGGFWFAALWVRFVQWRDLFAPRDDVAVVEVRKLWRQREDVIALHARYSTTADHLDYDAYRCPACKHPWPCPTLHAFGIYTEADWWRRNSQPTIAPHWLDLVKKVA